MKNKTHLSFRFSAALLLSMSLGIVNVMAGPGLPGGGPPPGNPTSNGGAGGSGVCGGGVFHFWTPFTGVIDVVHFTG